MPDVYHHCLFGTRYDFLCANYTAFDQTLFNCNFVSNVDCENSKKFWHRNDELYIEKSTTTPAPAINYNFYTPPPQGPPLTPSPINGRPSLEDTAGENPLPRRQAAARPRATRPPARPHYDYYEDYEELPRPKGRKRFRPRARPVYYDDYEDYEDVRIGRRNGGRRRPHSRRPARRNKDRRTPDYEEEEDYLYEEDDFVLSKKPKTKRRKLAADYEDEDDRPSDKRRPQGSRRSTASSRKKRPIDDYDYEEEDVYNNRKLNDRGRDGDRRRIVTEEDKKIPRLGKRRPPSQEYEDDLQQADSPGSVDAPRKSNKDKDGRPIIKPASGTIYDRPRVAPRINLPVPKNAAEKFAYKPIGNPTTAAAPKDEEEFYDYEETAKSDSSEETGEQERASANSKVEKNPTGPNKNEEESYAEVEKPTSKSTTTTEHSIDRSPMPVIRKFKRPFLPSRGGNPYSPRNLQPVGAKATEESQEIDLGESSVMRSVADPAETASNKNEDFPDPKQNPVKVARVILTTGAEESTLRGVAEEEPKSGIIRVKVPVRSNQNFYGAGKYDISESVLTTTIRPKLPKEDILNGNYDVSLNEAISPIIPHLPSRSFGTYNAPADYTYKRFPRPTKYVILDPVVSAGNAYYVK